MKKLTDLQVFRLDEAHRHVKAVLLELCADPALEGNERERAKTLEAIMLSLEGAKEVS